MKRQISSPKQFSKEKDVPQKSMLYQYYPGFSEIFVKQIINSYYKDDMSPIIVDPWNGSGTTTYIASNMGFRCYGYDINPVMVIVAKAKLHICKNNENMEFLEFVKQQYQISEFVYTIKDDPLEYWFTYESIEVLRKIEHLTLLYCNQNKSKEVINNNTFDNFSNKLSFLYVSLFSVVRTLTHKFNGSNPTWIKVAEDKSELVSINFQCIFELLKDYFSKISPLHRMEPEPVESFATINIADSKDIPIQSNTIDFIITSPPYCTRIDYAIYTRVELAYLGISKNSFNDLRNKMIGTPTITPQSGIGEYPFLGEYCSNLLSSIAEHYSKASKSYYYKTYQQYFVSISKSLKEIQRILKPNGKAVIVIQDSWFKDIYIDIPKILIEISQYYGIILSEKFEFKTVMNMVNINKNSKKYRDSSGSNESVLVLIKEAI